jgi:hypothetical protein
MSIEFVVWLQGFSALSKALLTGAVGLMFALFLVLLWQKPGTTTANVERPAQAVPASGPVINQNVTSHGQSGGITAHTVNSDAAKK